MTAVIAAWVLAELSRRDLVPAIWLPDFEVRQERERARWRLHLVKHRSALKQRVHSALMCLRARLPGLRSVRPPAARCSSASISRTPGEPTCSPRSR